MTATMHAACVLCGFPMNAAPMFGDQAHNSLETCIALLKAELEKYRPAQAPMELEARPEVVRRYEQGEKGL